MQSKPGFLYKIPFYPLLLGFYPVLYLWLVNVYNIPPSIILQPLLISLALTAIVCAITLLILRDLRKAAAVASLFLGLFFIYGRIFDLVANFSIFGILLGTPLGLLLVWLAIFFGISFLLVRTRSGLSTLTWIANLVVSFLLLMTLGQLAYAGLGRAKATLANPTPASSLKFASLNQSASANSPDVYYILLDGFDREDLLQENIGLSDHTFITQLEQMGFVVPSCTQSNYNSTAFSVAGTFNMNYLDALGFSYQDLSNAAYGIEFSTPALEASIHANPVMQEFQMMGYQLISFQEPYSFINFPSSDIVYDYDKDEQSAIESTKFQNMFWQTTGLDFVLAKTTGNSSYQFKNLPDWIERSVSPAYGLNQKYQTDLYQLSQLDHITAVPGKKFVYAHLLITHPDFAFTATGALRDSSIESKAGYADQVSYASQRILAIVKNILATSKTPPIIILQGDHGYGIAGRGVEQFKILNAYYLPAGGSPAVYPSITPVNTFRLILSRYFGQNLPLLPDQSIWIHSQFPGGSQLEPSTCEPH